MLTSYGSANFNFPFQTAMAR
uniref:Uncharacterized protein n=1 Tax=Rhizophora mucronata TaxID=61149 RepID=A0A2P2JLU2_RHIMU